MNPETPITPDDPRLSAFALGELEGAELDAVAAAVAADPRLQRAVASLRSDLGQVRAQLRAAEAEGGQLEFSSLLEQQVLARLEREASAHTPGNSIAAHALDDSIAARALGGTERRLGQRALADTADWRDGLDRDARRRVVWWSPFALPLAACFVAVACVGLLWWNGVTGPQEFTRPQALRLSDTSPQPQFTQAAMPAAAVAEQTRLYYRRGGDSATQSPSAKRATAVEGQSVAATLAPQSAAAGSARIAAPADVEQQSASTAARQRVPRQPVASRGSRVGLGAVAVGEDLFAPRVWAYLPSGAEVRESGLSASGSTAPQPATQTLLAAATVTEPSATPLPESGVAPFARTPFAASASATPSAASLTGQSDVSLAAPSVAEPSALADSVSPVTSFAGAAATAPATQPSAEARSAQVLAGAATLVKPVDAAAIDADLDRVDGAQAVAGVSASTAASAPLSTVASVSVSSAASAPVSIAVSTPVPPPASAYAPTAGLTPAPSTVLVSARSEGGSGESVAASPRSGSAGELAVDGDGDTGEAVAVETVSPTASQIVAVAAAKHFSRASLAELEAAAFASGGTVWPVGGDDVAAAAAQVAQAQSSATAASGIPAQTQMAGAPEAAAAPASAFASASALAPVPASAPAPASALASAPASVPVRQLDLSSRYVQMKLWVEAGQLPPPASIDVDAIVRDAVPVYAATALRQIRAQAARTAASAQGGQLLEAQPAPAPRASAQTSFVAAGSAEPVAISAKELELLESRSLMLRLVRAYATLLKDRPADAVLQLDALAGQLKQRPRLANGSYGQEFLKLLEATRPLL